MDCEFFAFARWITIAKFFLKKSIALWTDGALDSKMSIFLETQILQHIKMIIFHKERHLQVCSEDLQGLQWIQIQVTVKIQ
jgi:hypothetical protein